MRKYGIGNGVSQKKICIAKFRWIHTKFRQNVIQICENVAAIWRSFVSILIRALYGGGGSDNCRGDGGGV
jgi:hypothetical protein